MKKILFFAFALVASVLAFTSCNGNEPEIEGKVYHYDASLTLNDAVGTTYNFQIYFTRNDKNNVSMRWENVKYDGKTFDLYYTGKCEKVEDEVYEMYIEDKVKLKDGTPFDGFGTIRASFEFGDKVTWFSRDAHLIQDGEDNMAWINGTLVKDDEPGQDPLVGTWAHVEYYGNDRSEVKYTFDGSNNFSYSDYKYMGGQVHYGQIFKGSYRIDGDMVYVHYTGFSWTNDGEHMEEQTDFEPYDENFKYSISGNTLTIIRGEDTETYTKQ